MLERRLFTASPSKHVGFWAKTRQQASFILNGIKLFAHETKQAQLLKQKIRDQKHIPTRSEFVFVTDSNQASSKPPGFTQSGTFLFYNNPAT